MATNNPLRVEIASPVGRIVQGDCYEPQTTDMDGKPLVTKSGPNAGQARVNYFVGLAIEKNHPGLAEFYGKYLEVARASFPHLFDAQGNCTHPQFAWKYIDGDGRDTSGKPWADREGFAGHYVFRFASGFAPQLLQMQNGTAVAIPDSAGKAIRRGFYAQVICSIEGNGNAQKPGLYTNLHAVVLAGYGKEIMGGVDVAAALRAAPQTGAGYVPAGMSMTPPAVVSQAQPAVAMQPPGGMAAPGQMQPPGQAMPGMQPPGGMAAPGQMQPPGQAMPGMQPPGGMATPGQMQPPGQAMPGMQPPGGMAAPGQAQGSFVQSVLQGQLVPTQAAQGHDLAAWRGMGYTDDQLVQQGIFVRQ